MLENFLPDHSPEQHEIFVQKAQKWFKGYPDTQVAVITLDGNVFHPKDFIHAVRHTDKIIKDKDGRVLVMDREGQFVLSTRTQRSAQEKITPGLAMPPINDGKISIERMDNDQLDEEAEAAQEAVSDALLALTEAQEASDVLVASKDAVDNESKAAALVLADVVERHSAARKEQATRRGQLTKAEKAEQQTDAAYAKAEADLATDPGNQSLQEAKAAAEAAATAAGTARAQAQAVLALVDTQVAALEAELAAATNSNELHTQLKASADMALALARQNLKNAEARHNSSLARLGVITAARANNP